MGPSFPKWGLIDWQFDFQCSMLHYSLMSIFIIISLISKTNFLYTVHKSRIISEVRRSFPRHRFGSICLTYLISLSTILRCCYKLRHIFVTLQLIGECFPDLSTLTLFKFDTYTLKFLSLIDLRNLYQNEILLHFLI